jgi:hypothetical protein
LLFDDDGDDVEVPLYVGADVVGLQLTCKWHEPGSGCGDGVGFGLELLVV